MRRAATVLLAVMLAGCGDDAERPAAKPTGLLVTVYPQGRDAGPIRTHRAQCPDPVACRDELAPVPADAICTRIYGGPAKATVRGVLGGERVDAEFSLSGGCEIERWKQASDLLGPIPG